MKKFICVIDLLAKLIRNNTSIAKKITDVIDILYGISDKPNFGYVNMG